MKNFHALLIVLLSTVALTAQTTTSTTGSKPSVMPVRVSPAAQPLFNAPDMSGRMVNTDDLKGKLVVLNLWFVNCPNCLEEIGRLNDLVDQYKDNKDVVFIGLAASKKPDLEKFLAKHPFKYQIIPNAQMIIISKFGTPDQNGDINVPFPMHYVLDREGKTLVHMQGVKGVDAVKAELAKQITAK